MEIQQVIQGAPRVLHQKLPVEKKKHVSFLQSKRISNLTNHKTNDMIREVAVPTAPQPRMVKQTGGAKKSGPTPPHTIDSDDSDDDSDDNYIDEDWEDDDDEWEDDDEDEEGSEYTDDEDYDDDDDDDEFMRQFRARRPHHTLDTDTVCLRGFPHIQGFINNNGPRGNPALDGEEGVGMTHADELSDIEDCYEKDYKRGKHPGMDHLLREVIFSIPMGGGSVNPVGGGAGYGTISDDVIEALLPQLLNGKVDEVKKRELSPEETAILDKKKAFLRRLLKKSSLQMFGAGATGYGELTVCVDKTLLKPVDRDVFGLVAKSHNKLSTPHRTTGQVLNEHWKGIGVSIYDRTAVNGRAMLLAARRWFPLPPRNSCSELNEILLLDKKKLTSKNEQDQVASAKIFGNSNNSNDNDKESESKKPSNKKSAASKPKKKEKAAESKTIDPHAKLEVKYPDQFEYLNGVMMVEADCGGPQPTADQRQKVIDLSKEFPATAAAGGKKNDKSVVWETDEAMWISQPFLQTGVIASKKRNGTDCEGVGADGESHRSKRSQQQIHATNPDRHRGVVDGGLRTNQTLKETRNWCIMKHAYVYEDLVLSGYNDPHVDDGTGIRSGFADHFEDHASLKRTKRTAIQGGEILSDPETEASDTEMKALKDRESNMFERYDAAFKEVDAAKKKYAKEKGKNAKFPKEMEEEIVAKHIAKRPDFEEYCKEFAKNGGARSTLAEINRIDFIQNDRDDGTVEVFEYQNDFTGMISHALVSPPADFNYVHDVLKIVSRGKADFVCGEVDGLNNDSPSSKKGTTTEVAAATTSSAAAPMRTSATTASRDAKPHHHEYYVNRRDQFVEKLEAVGARKQVLYTATDFNAPSGSQSTNMAGHGLPKPVSLHSSNILCSISDKKATKAGSKPRPKLLRYHLSSPLLMRDADQMMVAHAQDSRRRIQLGAQDAAFHRLLTTANATNYADRFVKPGTKMSRGEKMMLGIKDDKVDNINEKYAVDYLSEGEEGNPNGPTSSGTPSRSAKEAQLDELRRANANFHLVRPPLLAPKHYPKPDGLRGIRSGAGSEYDLPRVTNNSTAQSAILSSINDQVAVTSSISNVSHQDGRSDIIRPYLSVYYDGDPQGCSIRPSLTKCDAFSTKEMDFMGNREDGYDEQLEDMRQALLDSDAEEGELSPFQMLNYTRSDYCFNNSHEIKPKSIEHNDANPRQYDRCDTRTMETTTATDRPYFKSLVTSNRVYQTSTQFISKEKGANSLAKAATKDSEGPSTAAFQNAMGLAKMRKQAFDTPLALCNIQEIAGETVKVRLNLQKTETNASNAQSTATVPETVGIAADPNNPDLTVFGLTKDDFTKQFGSYSKEVEEGDFIYGDVVNVGHVGALLRMPLPQQYLERCVIYAYERQKQLLELGGRSESDQKGEQEIKSFYPATLPADHRTQNANHFRDPLHEELLRYAKKESVKAFSEQQTALFGLPNFDAKEKEEPSADDCFFNLEKMDLSSPIESRETLITAMTALSHNCMNEILNQFLVNANPAAFRNRKMFSMDKNSSLTLGGHPAGVGSDLAVPIDLLNLAPGNEKTAGDPEDPSWFIFVKGTRERYRKIYELCHLPLNTEQYKKESEALNQSNKNRHARKRSMTKKFPTSFVMKSVGGAPTPRPLS